MNLSQVSHPKEPPTIPVMTAVLELMPSTKTMLTSCGFSGCWCTCFPLQVPLSCLPANSPLQDALCGHIENSDGSVVGKRGAHTGCVLHGCNWSSIVEASRATDHLCYNVMEIQPESPLVQSVLQSALFSSSTSFVLDTTAAVCCGSPSSIQNLARTTAVCRDFIYLLALICRLTVPGSPDKNCWSNDCSQVDVFSFSIAWSRSFFSS